MLSNHSDRRVTVVEHPDGSRTLAKTYRRANGRQIFDEHVALWNSPFGRMRDLPGIPRPLHFDPANATVTMELIEGIPLGRSNEVDPKIAHCGNAARLLVDFHHSGVIVSRRRSAPSIVRSLQRKAVDLRSSQLGEQYCRLLHRVANMLPQAEDLVVSHGDFSPRNVLRCKARLVIIDLDRLQMSSPARDLAYWGAWGLGDTTLD